MSKYVRYKKTNWDQKRLQDFAQLDQCTYKKYKITFRLINLFQEKWRE